MNGLGLYYKESDNELIFGYFLEGTISKELQRFTNDAKQISFSKYYGEVFRRVRV